MNITIRDERVEDIATIEALTNSAFLHAEQTSCYSPIIWSWFLC